MLQLDLGCMQKAQNETESETEIQRLHFLHSGLKFIFSFTKDERLSIVCHIFHLNNRFLITVSLYHGDDAENLQNSNQ